MRCVFSAGITTTDPRAPEGKRTIIMTSEVLRSGVCLAFGQTRPRGIEPRMVLVCHRGRCVVRISDGIYVQTLSESWFALDKGLR